MKQITLTLYISFLFIIITYNFFKKIYYQSNSNNLIWPFCKVCHSSKF